MCALDRSRPKKEPNDKADRAIPLPFSNVFHRNLKAASPRRTCLWISVGRYGGALRNESAGFTIVIKRDRLRVKENRSGR